MEEIEVPNDLSTNDKTPDRLKYSSNSITPLLDGNKIILPKFTDKQIKNLKKKYISKVPKKNVDLKKRRKRRNKSDPEVNSITNLLNNSLLIISPEKRLSIDKDMNSSNCKEVNKDSDSSENKIDNKIDENVDIKKEEIIDNCKKSKSALNNGKRRPSLSLKNGTEPSKDEKSKEKTDVNKENKKLDTKNKEEKKDDKNLIEKLDGEDKKVNDLKEEDKKLKELKTNSKNDIKKDEKKSKDVRKQEKQETKKTKRDDKKSKEDRKSNSKKEESKPDIKKDEKSDLKKVVFRTDKNIKISPNACPPSNEKKNAFQFMMDSRHKSIGQNSPGKERVEDSSSSSEKNENKSKLKSRKLFLEEWSDKKGGLKRKIEEEAKEKYIEKTLDKRAKRLKTMLTLKNKEKDEDEFTPSKANRKKTRILSESDNSNDSTDVKLNKNEEKNDVKCKETENDEKSEENKLEEKSELNEEHELECDQIFLPQKLESPLKKKQNNEKIDDILLSPSLKKTSLLHYFDITNKSKEITTEESSKNKENIMIKTTEVDESDLIKIKLNFTPKKSKNKDSSLNDSLSLSMKSKKIKKKKKRSLSLRKIDDDNKSLKEEEEAVIEDLKKKENDDKVQVENNKQGVEKEVNNDMMKDDVEVIKCSDEPEGCNTENSTKTPKHKKSHHKKKDKHKHKEKDDSIIIIRSPDGCTGREIDISTPKSKKLGNPSQFTPRTWRMKLRQQEEAEKSDTKDSVNDDVIICDDLIFPPESNSNESSVGSQKDSSQETKKDVKIAPLFLMKQRRSDLAAANEAKKKFLYSGVPSKMKKLMDKQPRNLSNEDVILSLFPKISHVQQRTEDEMKLWDLPNTSLLIPETDTEEIDYNIEKTIGIITDCKKVDITKQHQIVRAPPRALPNIKTYIKDLKKSCPEFPVYKFFRVLREKCGKRYNLPKEPEEKKEVPVEEKKPKRRGRPKKKKVEDENSIIIELEVSDLTPSQNIEVSTSSVAIWTEKYKAQSSEEIIGNSSSVTELKNWLSSWVEYSIEQRTTNRKRRRLNSGSSNDFCSDSDTRDTDIIPLNTMILLGPCGSGKTSTVYALCNELKINVIELNASSKRPGKRILQELQEATKSHQVKNTDSTSNNFFYKINNDNQECDKKEMTLLLVEDADIVFDDQDEGFVSALMSLVSTSKRPIIITSSDQNCAHLQKFIAMHKVIKFSNYPSKLLGTWLEILCMVEGIKVDRTEVSKLLDWNRGDIRKTLLELQFWVQSGGDKSEEVEKNDFFKALSLSSRRVSMEPEVIVLDESSNLSWMSNEEVNNEEVKTHESCAKCFISYQNKDKKGFQLPYPVDLGNLWWNIPNIYDVKPSEHNRIFSNLEIKILKNDCGETPDLFSTQDSVVTNRKTSRAELDAIGDMLDMIAYTDVVYRKNNFESDFQPCTEYWKIGPVNSLSFEENMKNYKETDVTSIEITQWLIENSVKQYREISNNKIDTFCYNPAVPVYDERRWCKKQHKSMEGLTEAVPVQSQIDRRSLCVDYISSLRTICRSEQLRFIANNKRKNRFYHYLKGLNVHLSDSMYEVVCNTLAHYENV